MATEQPPQYGDENRQGSLTAVNCLTIVLVIIFVLSRLATRIWIVRKVGADDYTIFCALLCDIIGFALVIVQIKNGFGRHKYYLTERQYTVFSRYSYGEWIQTFQTLMFTKLSICFLLLRIPVEKHFIRPIQLAIVFLIITNIVLTLLWIFQCNPIAGAWNKKMPSKCFTDAQLLKIILSQAVISIISDFALALFPIALLWKVQMNPRHKAGLCALMALGLITAACCTVRTALNWQNVTSDPTWTSVYNLYWRAAEVNFGIIAACLPPLRPAYATTTSFLKSYLSRVSTKRSSTFTRIVEGKSTKARSDEEPIVQRGTNAAQQITSPLEAASHDASAEVDRARKYGIGEEGFEMKSIPGDRTSMDSGIKKTTRVDVEVSSPRSLALGGGERGDDGTYFV